MSFSACKDVSLSTFVKVSLSTSKVVCVLVCVFVIV